jgi:hypothetical protein
LRSFGGVTQSKEVYREVRSVLWVDDVKRDVQYALRTFVRNPMFSGVIVLTLALGIGVTTGIFSVVSAVMFRPLPYRDADPLGAKSSRTSPPEESFRGAALRTSAMNLDELFWWRGHTKTCRTWRPRSPSRARS